MLSEGVQRNTITYDTAIIACEKGWRWQQALELFERRIGERAAVLNVMRETIQVAVLARMAGRGSSPWNSSKVCQLIR